MKRLISFPLPLTFLAFLFSSCLIAIHDYSARRDLSFEGKFYKKITFKSGGTLSLKNINGNIEIKGWDRDEVELTAQKTFRESFERRIYFFPLRNPLPRVDIEKDESSISIRTRVKSFKEEGLSYVDYFLQVPRSINLKDITCEEGDVYVSDLFGEVSVKIEKGDVILKNFSGSVRASTVRGSIEMELLDIREYDEVRVLTRQGDIVIYLEPDVNAQIEARSSRGEVSCEFELEKVVPGEKFSAELGGGGALISLKSLEGRIFIRKIT